jgi:hypothetical protein
MSGISLCRLKNKSVLLVKIFLPNYDPSNHYEVHCVAGMVSFARRILTTCWDGILDILSVLITGRSACGVNGSLALMFNAKEESRRARQAICTSLEGLKTAAMLSSTLGLLLFLPRHFLLGHCFQHNSSPL